jgi:L-malate glycosyltransferase
MRPRVALISPYTLPVVCGNSFLADRIQRGLPDRNYEVALFNSNTDAPEEAVRFEPQILHSINAERPERWVRKVLRKIPAPWLITLTGTDYTGWSGITEPPGSIRRNLERADLLAVFHDEARRAIGESLPSVQVKLRVIPQSVAASTVEASRQKLRKDLRINRDDLVFLMVASVRPVKNLTFAVRAFEAVKPVLPQARMFLIGPVIDEAEGVRLFARTDGVEGFHYLGEKQPEEVLRYMAAADVFLNTSISEGMPGSVLEAMTGGLPVLASNVTGNRAVVMEGETGLLFPLDNLDNLISSMTRVGSDRALRRRLGRRGKGVVTTHYGTTQEIDGYDRLYRELLGLATERRT